MKYSLSRVSNLIRRDLVLYKKPLITYSLGLIAVNLIMLIFLNRGHGNPLFWELWYWKFLIVISIGFTSSAFVEFRDSNRKQQYLNLPASTLEKYSVRWVFSMIIVPIVITIVFMIFQKLSGGNIASLFDQIIDKNFLIVLIVLNAWLFLCSSMFDKSLTAVGYTLGGAILLLIIASLLLLLFFCQFSDGFFINSNRFSLSEDFIESIGPKLMLYIKVFLSFVLPPIFWLISYYKLKEQET